MSDERESERRREAEAERERFREAQERERRAREEQAREAQKGLLGDDRKPRYPETD